MRYLEQRERILGESRSATAGVCVEELGTDTVVHPDTACDILNVCADFLAKTGHFVDEGDLRLKECSAFVFDQLAGRLNIQLVIINDQDLAIWAQVCEVRFHISKAVLYY